MNIWLFAVIAPLTGLLVFDDVLTMRTYYAMRDGDKKIFIGGMGEYGVVFFLWFWTAFTLSAVGLCGSFYLHLFLNNSIVPVFIYATFHLSLIVWNSACIEQNIPIVFICVVVNVIAYLSLTIYTFYLFPSVWMLHICNVMLVVHALLNDFFIWQWGWWREMNLYNVIHQEVI
jgi:hypothetical protein